MRIFTTLIFVLSGTISLFGQAIPVGQDTTVCPNDTVQISATFNSAGFMYMDDAIELSLNDDAYSDVLNMGFTFLFFNDTTSNIIIGSNGVITFRNSAANGYCPWSPVTPLPNPTAQLRSIYCPWYDYDTSTVIRYKTIGTAPNRQFIVQYIPHMTNCTGGWTTTVVLSETTNTIDYYINNKPACVTGPAGIINGGATLYYDITSNNPATISGIFSKRLTRLSNTQYSISSIPFINFVDLSFTPVWVTGNGVSPFAPEIAVSPTAVEDAYAFVGLTCPLFGAQNYLLYSDTSVVSAHPPLSFTGTQTTPVTCYGDANGSITVTHSVMTPPFEVIWNNQITTDLYFDSLAPGTYNFQLIDTFGCIKPMSATVAGSSSPLDVVLIPDSSGMSDNSFTLAVSGGTPPYVYYLDSVENNGPVFDSLAVGVYAVVVEDLYGCTDTLIVGIPIQLQQSGINAPTEFPLLVGPNPVTERLYIYAGETTYQLTVRSLSGEELISQLITTDQSIDLSRLATGMYLVILSNSNGSEWMKPIVKK